MKKLIYGSIFLALVGIGIVCCKKSIINPSSQNLITSSEFNISSDGKMLIFKTTDDYKKVVNDPTEEIKSKFLKEVANL
jgi:hypothetical protein